VYTLYNLFKFLHITAAMVWVGSAATRLILTSRLARDGTRSSMTVMMPQTVFLGQVVVTPSAVATLVTGIVVMGVGRIPFPLWTAWGVAGVIGSLIIDAAFSRRAYEELEQAMASSQPDVSLLDRARRRVGILGVVNLLLLVSTVWAMVFKPSL
jgi:uncharacterized membrane protein